MLRWAGAGACLSLVGVAVGDVTSNSMEFSKQELALPKWDADGFRVGFIADTHVTSPATMRRAQSAAKWVVEQKPDLIILGGDYISRSTKLTLGLVKGSLEPIREAKCPVFAVMGNHDYYAPSPERVIRTVEDSGAKVLRNEFVEVGGVTIAGIDDAIFGKHEAGMEMLLEEGHSKSLLAILHEPDFADDMPGHVSLQLSGHSHGGQICLPGGIPSETRIGARKYSAGSYSESKVPLYVTRGVGTSGPDLRLFCRPEATILTLRGA